MVTTTHEPKTKRTTDADITAPPKILVDPVLDPMASESVHPNARVLLHRGANTDSKESPTDATTKDSDKRKHDDNDNAGALDDECQASTKRWCGEKGQEAHRVGCPDTTEHVSPTAITATAATAAAAMTAAERAREIAVCSGDKGGLVETLLYLESLDDHEDLRKEVVRLRKAAQEANETAAVPAELDSATSSVAASSAAASSVAAATTATSPAAATPAAITTATTTNMTKQEINRKLWEYNDTVGSNIEFETISKTGRGKPCESCFRRFQPGDPVYVNEGRGSRFKLCQPCLLLRFENPDPGDNIGNDEDGWLR